MLHQPKLNYKAKTNKNQSKLKTGFYVITDKNEKQGKIKSQLLGKYISAIPIVYKLLSNISEHKIINKKLY